MIKRLIGAICLGSLPLIAIGQANHPEPQPFYWCKHPDGSSMGQVTPCGPGMIDETSPTQQPLINGTSQSLPARPIDTPSPTSAHEPDSNPKPTGGGTSPKGDIAGAMFAIAAGAIGRSRGRSFLLCFLGGGALWVAFRVATAMLQTSH